jgi:TMEM175 potassium channel family protein
MDTETDETAFEPSALPGIKGDKLGLERIMFFSDAVFAIAITLLALEVSLPEIEGQVTNAQLLQNLLAIWPKYLGFVISFLVIGATWMGHHKKFGFINRYDRNLMMLNLLLLMFVAFLPFPTLVISEYGNRTATIFYALSVIMIGLMMALIWWYASSHHRLISPQVSQSQCRHEMQRTLVVPIVFGLSILIAFINDDLAKFSWLLVALV